MIDLISLKEYKKRVYLFFIFSVFSVGCDDTIVSIGNVKNNWQNDYKEADENSNNFTQNQNYLVRGVVAEKTTSIKIIRKLAKDISWYVREKIASNEHSTSEILHKLATDSSLHVRRSVAKNQKTKENTLRILAKDIKWQVRFAIVKNRNVPLEILDTWSQSNSHFVKKELFYMLSQSNQVFIPFVAFLQKKEESERCSKICEQIASYECVNEKNLRFLSDYDEWEVRLQVAKNLNTPVKCLWILAKDDDESVRSEVVNNNNVPIAILETMIEDEDEDVQEEVLEILEKRKDYDN